MSKKILVLCVLLFAMLHKANAQEETGFKPKGQVLARGFVNVNTGYADHFNGVNLDVKRAYLGYNYKFTPNLEATVLADIAAGKDKSNRFRPALKNAFLKWHKKGLTLTAGLMGLYQFRDQESYWGHRYTYKSFQDHYKFGHSADLGLAIKYQIIKALSVDFAWTNGEGYKTIQGDKSNRYQLGLSVLPVKNLLLRLYADMYNNSKGMHPSNLASYDQFSHQYTYALFIGYKNQYVKAGLEYNHQMNANFQKARNQSGYSAYCTVSFNKKWNTFARFDLLTSSKEKGKSWNRRDGQFAMLGVEYTPCKNVKIAPNFRFNHNDRDKKNNYALFVNLEFRLR